MYIMKGLKDTKSQIQTTSEPHFQHGFLISSKRHRLPTDQPCSDYMNTCSFLKKTLLNTVGCSKGVNQVNQFLIKNLLSTLFHEILCSKGRSVSPALTLNNFIRILCLRRQPVFVGLNHLCRRCQGVALHQQESFRFS